MLLNKIKFFENTEEGFEKKRNIIRSAIVELLPPNKVLADHVAARLEKEKSNLLNATEMQMAKIYSIPDKKSKKEGEQETAPSPTISSSIELPTLYEVGKKCAYTDKEKNPRAAIWFYDLGISQDGYERYLSWTPKDDKESMPDVFIDLADIGYPGYYLKRLDKEDPRIATAGRETSCCQHVDGAGKSCAKHAVTDPNGALYAIFERTEHSVGRNISPEDVMVAQSWAWRGERNVHNERDFVFDSVESHLNFRVKNQPLLSDAFTYLGHKLASEKNDIGRVIVGKDRYANTPKRIGVLDLEKNELATPDHNNIAHRDSKKNQGIIASRHFPYVQLYLVEHADAPKAFVEAVRENPTIIDEVFIEKFKNLIFRTLNTFDINQARNSKDIKRVQELEQHNINSLKYLLTLPRKKSIRLQDLKNKEGLNPLLEAVFNDYISPEILNILIEHIDINAKDDQGNTALYYAIDKWIQTNRDDYAITNRGGSVEQSKFFKQVKFLLDKGASLLIKNSEGDSPLRKALIFGYLLGIDFLLSQKQIKELNDEEKEFLSSAIIKIIDGGGNLDMLERFLGWVSPNQMSHRGIYPLEYALQQGKLKAIKLLLKHKADLSIKKTQEQKTQILEQAFRLGPEIAELFLPLLPRPLNPTLTLSLFTLIIRFPVPLVQYSTLNSIDIAKILLKEMPDPLTRELAVSLFSALSQNLTVKAIKESGLFELIIEKAPRDLIKEAIGLSLLESLSRSSPTYYRTDGKKEIIQFLLSFQPILPENIIQQSIKDHLNSEIFELIINSYTDEKIKQEKLKQALDTAITEELWDHGCVALLLMPAFTSKDVALFSEAIQREHGDFLLAFIEKVEDKAEKEKVLEFCLSKIAKQILDKRPPSEKIKRLLNHVIEEGANLLWPLDPNKPEISVFETLIVQAKTLGLKIKHEHLMKKIEAGDKEILVRLIQLHLPIYFYSFLHAIFRFNQKDTLKVLLEEHINPRSLLTNVEITRLFGEAMNQNSLWQLRFLVETLKIDPETEDLAFSEILTYHLQRKNNDELIAYLIKKFPRSIYRIFNDLIDISGLALQADKNKAITNIQRLIDAGFDVKSCEKYSIFPLRIAMENRNIEMASFLIKNEIPPPPRDRDLETAIDLHSVDLVKAILEHPGPPKIDPNIKLPVGFGQSQTPLDRAIKNGDFEIAILLLKHEADPNERTVILPDYGKIQQQLTQPSASGQTQGDGLLVSFDDGLEPPIISTAPEPNVETSPGDTPTMLAIRNNSMPLFKALLQAKADLRLTNEYNETAEMIAETLGREEMLALIKKSLLSQESPAFTPALDAQFKKKPRSPGGEKESEESDHRRPE